MTGSKFLSLAFILFGMIVPMNIVAEGNNPEVVERFVKSAFIYQFTKFIVWPPRSGDFAIVIVADESLLTVLNDMVAGKTVGARAIRVRAEKGPLITEPADIVVFPKASASKFKVGIEKLQGKHSLIVTHAEEAIPAGAMVNLLMVDQKMKFELSQKTLKGNGLGISETLLKLAKIID